jgi:hypothetical protein
MRVRVKYSGSELKRLTGVPEEWMDLAEHDRTTAGVLAALRLVHGEDARQAASRVLLLVNGVMVRDGGRSLSEGDIVEILPLSVGG